MRKIFIDGGANIGQSISAFCNHFPNSEEFEIYSFEASQTTSILSPLREVAEGHRNKTKNIELFNKAVWTHDGHITFFDNIKGSESSSILYRSQFIDNSNVVENKIECIDLSNWIKNNFSKDDFIILKLDIEGAEYDIIKKLYDDNTLQYIDKFYCEIHGVKCGKGYEESLELIRMVKDGGVPFYDWTAESYGEEGDIPFTEEKLKGIFIAWYTQWAEDMPDDQFSPYFKQEVIHLLPNMVGVPGASAVIPLNNGHTCIVQLHNSGILFATEEHTETTTETRR